MYFRPRVDTFDTFGAQNPELVQLRLLETWLDNRGHQNIDVPHLSYTPKVGFQGQDDPNRP